MINKQILNNTLKELKTFLKNSKGSTFTEIRRQLEKKYEKISNREDKNYDEIYDLAKLIQCDALGKLIFKIDKKMIVVIELVEDANAPMGIVFFYNEFLNNKQCGIELYTLKEIKE